MKDLWDRAYDDMNDIDAREKDLTVDQRLKVAGIKALLAIGELLTHIREDITSASGRGES